MAKTTGQNPGITPCVDAHQHFWDFDPVRDAWITEDMEAIRRDFTPYDLLDTLKRNGVSGTVAVQANPSENETSFLVDIAERNDFIMGVVGWVDFLSSGVGERLDFYHRSTARLKGFRHIVQAEPDSEFLLGKEFCSGISLLAGYGYTYDILIYPHQLPSAIRFVEKFPEQDFVIDHLAKPNIKNREIEPWATHMRDISKHPRVCCKVSGMVTEADWRIWQPEDLKPYLDVVFEAFGPERLMFGSDWPACLVAADYQRVKGVVTDYIAPYTPEQRAGVMGGNATRFYRLETTR